MQWQIDGYIFVYTNKLQNKLFIKAVAMQHTWSSHQFIARFFYFEYFYDFCFEEYFEYYVVSR